MMVRRRRHELQRESNERQFIPGWWWLQSVKETDQGELNEEDDDVEVVVVVVMVLVEVVDEGSLWDFVKSR